MNPKMEYNKKRNHEYQDHQTKHDIPYYYTSQRKHKYHCKIHGNNDTHDWTDCRKNPKNENYLFLSKKKKAFKKPQEERNIKRVKFIMPLIIKEKKIRNINMILLLTKIIRMRVNLSTLESL